MCFKLSIGDYIKLKVFSKIWITPDNGENKLLVPYWSPNTSYMYLKSIKHRLLVFFYVVGPITHRECVDKLSLHAQPWCVI